jgi:hypothetical protein
MKKRIFFTIVCCLFFVGNQIAGTFDPADDHAGNRHESGWNFSKTSQNVEFHYKVQDCNGQKVVFLRLVNSNDFEVQVNWTEVFGDKISGRKIQAFNGEKQVVLKAGQTIQAEDCERISQENFVTILSKVTPTHVIEMESFEIIKIEITPSN